MDNEWIAERRQNLVSDKQSKTGIVLHMPTVHTMLRTHMLTVHPMVLNTARTELLKASIIFPLVLEPCVIYKQRFHYFYPMQSLSQKSLNCLTSNFNSN